MMKKRLISLLLCAALMLGSMPVYAGAPETAAQTEGAMGSAAAGSGTEPEKSESDTLQSGGAITSEGLTETPAPPVGDGSSPEAQESPAAPWTGTGDAQTPYQIASEADLIALAVAVNSGPEYTGKYFQLQADITLTAPWTPIGTSASPFQGVFDGNGKKVSGLQIGLPETPATAPDQGFFGVISGAAVHNLTLEGSIYAKASGIGGLAGQMKNSTLSAVTNKISINNNEEGAGQSFGGLVGSISGGISRLERCENQGEVRSGGTGTGGIAGSVSANTVFSACKNTAAVSGTDSYVAGIAAVITGSGVQTTLESCQNSGAVSGGGTQTAGLIGKGAGTIELTGCINTGAIRGESSEVAGLIARVDNKLTMKDCHNTGAVSGDYQYVGGLVANFSYSASGLLEKSYNTGEVTATGSRSNYVGGLTASTKKCTMKNCYATGTVRNSGTGTAVGGLAGNMDSGDNFSSLYYYNEETPCRAFGRQSGTVSGVYILKADSYTGAVGGVPLSKESFQYGEAAYLLNGSAAHGTVWANGTVSPKFGDEGTAPLYEVLVKPKGFTSGAAVVVTPPAGSVVIQDAYSGVKLYLSAGASVGLAFTGAEPVEVKLKGAPESGLVSEGEGLYRITASSDLRVVYALESEANQPDVSWYAPNASAFLLTEEQELFGFTKLVNGETGYNNVDFAGQTVTLGANIAITAPWIPAGTKAAPFRGMLDGGGKTISGVQIGTAAAPVVEGYQGFLGYNEGTVKNLAVTGEIYSSGDYVGGVIAYNAGTVSGLTFGTAPLTEGGTPGGAVSGANQVGGVIGYSSTAVGSASADAFTNYAAVSGSGEKIGGIAGSVSKDLFRANNFGAVKGGSYVGGVVGHCASAVNQSSNCAAVEASGDYAGGIAGFCRSIATCKNEGLSVSGKAYVGGVAGSTQSSISGAQNRADVSAAGDYAGGVAGQAGSYVKDSVHMGKVSGGSYVGGVVGYATSYLQASANLGSEVAAKGDYAGGLCGYAKGYITGVAGQITFDGKVTGHDFVGGISGYAGGYIQQVVVGANARVLAADPADEATLTGLAGGIVARLEGATLSYSYCLGTVEGLRMGLLAGETADGSTVDHCFHYHPAQKAAGLTAGNAAKLVQNYYLAAEETADGGKTAAQFVSGEVAWLLDGGETTNSKTYYTQRDNAATPELGSDPVYRVRFSTGAAIATNRLVMGRGTGAEAFTKSVTEGTEAQHSQWTYVRSGAKLTFGIQCESNYELNFNPALPYDAIPAEEGQPAPAMPQYNMTVRANYDGAYRFTVIVIPTYEWYKNAPDDPASGTKIYNLATESDLLGLSNLVSGLDLGASGAQGPVDFAGQTVHLTADFAMLIGNWRSIGTQEKPFAGVFDGGAHKITSLRLDAYADGAGLFGFVRGGTIKDLQLEGQVISSGSLAGGVVGEASGGARVENVTLLPGSVVKARQNVGGLIGRVCMTAAEQNTALTGCRNYGEVIAFDSQNGFAGGLVGMATASTAQTAVTLKLEDCVNYGAVNAAGSYAGGLVGMSGAASSPNNYKIKTLITNCGNEGKVSASQYAGGLAGYLVSAADAEASVTASVNRGEVAAAGDYAGGLLGFGNQALTLEACANHGAITGGKRYTGGAAGALNSAAVLKNVGNHAAVTGAADYTGGLVGQIGSDARVNGCYGDADSAVRSSGAYTGGLFGTASGMVLADSYHLGLVEGTQYTGGIAGRMGGGSNAKVEKTYHGGIVSGTEYVGGIIGNQGNILVQTCWNEGTVIGTASNVGGISGYVDVSGYRIEACYNKGNVSSSGSAANVGGITGCNNFSGGGDWGIIGGAPSVDGGVKGCYNTGMISAPLGSAGQITGAYYSLNVNCYSVATGSDATSCGVLTADQFASGEASWLLDGGEGARLNLWTKGVEFPEFVSAARGAIYRIAVKISGSGTVNGATTDLSLFGASGEQVKLALAPSAGQKLFRLLCSLPKEQYTVNPESTEVSFSMPSANVTMTMVFADSALSENSLVVSFDANGGVFDGGNGAETVFVERAGSVQAPGEPAREKYAFQGWFSDASAAHAVSFPATVTEDTVFYAGWAYQGGSFAKGTGTAEDPYLIETAEDMYLMTQTAGSAEYRDKHYKVDAAELSLGMDWPGIGTESAPFTGSFDGNGATIRLAAGKGLFGTTGEGGCNVRIGNFKLEAVIFSGMNLTGGIVGFHKDGDLYLDNIIVSGSVSGGKATGGFLGGTNGNNWASPPEGGSMGKDTVHFTRCINHADVRGSGDYVGGFTGNMYANFVVEDCKNTGAVTGKEFTGGFFGWLNTGTMNKSGNTGEIKGTACVGGLMGGIAFYSGAQRYIESCYNTGNVTGGGTVAGIIGEGLSTGGENYKLENCFNAGTIAYTNGKAGSAITDESGITLTGCYALAGTISSKEAASVTPLSPEQLASGEAAFLLDQNASGRRNVWTQDVEKGCPTIGTPPFYPVTVNGTNGTVSVGGRTGGIYAGAGQTVQLTLVPQAYQENPTYGAQYGYVLKSVTVNGTVISGTTFVMPEQASEVTALFELKEIDYNERPGKEEPKDPVDPSGGTGEGSGTGDGGTGDGTGENTGGGQGGGVTEGGAGGSATDASGENQKKPDSQSPDSDGKTEQVEPQKPVIEEPLESQPEEEQQETPQTPDEGKEDDNLLEEEPEITETAERKVWPVVLLIVGVSGAALGTLPVLLRRKHAADKHTKTVQK